MELLTPGFFLLLAAYVVGGAIFYFFSRDRGFDRQSCGWLLLAGAGGGIIGAKVTRILFALTTGTNPGTLLSHPDGRTIIGGVLFGWLAIELVKKKLKIKRSTGDGFALGLSAGEAIGRIGCFFNGCCFGAASTVPWAVYQSGTLRHPAQLYSAFSALVIFLVLLFLRKKVRYEGDLFRIYLLLFGISRFAIEFVRERSDIHFGLSVAQWVSLEITTAMLIALAWIYFRNNSTTKEILD